MSHQQCLQSDQPTFAAGSIRRFFRSSRFGAAVVVTCAALVIALLGPARPAQAQVNTSGIVYAYGVPLTPPGLPAQYLPLPPDGSDLDYVVIEDPPNPPVSNADTFEFNVDPNPITGFDEIIVGKGGRGNVVILENTVLRSEHLIIGDTAEINFQHRPGTGTFRVSGFGAAYNSNPDITALLPSVQNSLSSPLPWMTALINVGGRDGYDLFVGRRDPSAGVGLVGGAGTLWIDQGGTVEIQDSAVVANDPGSTGTIVVDGPESFLGSGGFNGFSTPSDPRLMIIGRLGVGTMTISNGATVVSEAPLMVTGTNLKFGATIGSNPAEASARPVVGGEGIVTVTGVASSIPSPPEVPSKWVVGGSLQIGGFHDESQVNGIPTVNLNKDIEGDDVQYPTEAGAGTLNVNDGGLVTIRYPIVSATTDRLLLAIGRFGRLELDGGSVSVGERGAGTNGRNERVALFNDGVIQGDGRIDTGLFRNRYHGILRVNAGQSMIVAASAEFNPTSSIAIEEDPLVNFGLIEAIGTAEARALLEFERSPGTPLQPVRPFLNIPVFPPPNPTTFIGGMINAQHATLHFGSGIVNQGIMAFTAGVNVVKGLVVQAGVNAQLRIGPNTTVVIEGDCLGCVPTFVGGGNTLNILDPGTFTAAGIIQMTLSLSNPNLISAAGDIAISGLLDLTLANDVLADLATFGPGRYYEIISFTGGAYQPMIDENGFLVPDYSAPIPDCGTIIGPCSVPGMFAITSPDVSILGPAFADVEPIVQRIGHSIVVSFLDSGGIGVGLPGDYNNNGVVDAADYVVWRKHEGTTTVLPNDPFGGVIGANQYSLWRANFGAVPGAGAGGNSLSGTVPEPATLSLLLCIGLPALLRHRSR